MARFVNASHSYKKKTKHTPLIEQLLLEEELLRRNRRNMLSFYKPYQKQIDHHNAGAIHHERLLMAGNQLGKCKSITSTVETNNGPMRMIDIFGKNVKVLTYPNHEPRQVLAWIRKPAEECYRITMSDGRWFECPEGHQILTDDGYRPFSDIRATWLNLQESISGISQSIHASSVRRWMRRQLNYLYDCVVDHRQCDAQLLSCQDNVEVFVPSQVDALKRSLLSCGLDALERIDTSIHQLSTYLLSNLYGGCQTLARFYSSLNRASLHGAQRTMSNSPTVQQSYAPEDLRSKASSVNQHPNHISSLLPLLVEGNHIISIKSVGIKTLYDMEVEERHNYIAAGMVHHNSISGGAEWAMHLSGRYPDWWQGATFDKPVTMWASGVTNESTRDNPQRILVGPPAIKDDWGTGFIPGDALIETNLAMGIKNALDSVVVSWGGGGDIQSQHSALYFKSYEKGREKWQGPTLDGVWFDEEPPSEIYSEGKTRTQNGQNGIFTVITFTPLKGMSEVVNMFLLDDK